ncbi:MAG: ACP S-malonyltransferase [Pirellulales bacterium]|nr:ACP S-malonyltransferase [Pirellulales bacterium]
MSTAFLFPGQGAQTVGMGRADFDSSLVAKDLFQKASQILGYDLANLCFEGPAQKLDTTSFSQPALYVTSLAALAVLREKQPDLVEKVSITAGLSLGEYPALVFAGVMDFADGLRIVAERGAAMQAAADAVPSGMVSILGLDRPQVETICHDAAAGSVLAVANLLCPGNIVISGEKAALARASELAAERGAMKVIPLAVAGAFHTELMQGAVTRLRGALESVTLRPPRIPVVSNVDALPHSDVVEIRNLLVRQVCSPVLWENSQRYILGTGVTTCWEVGPGRVLRGLLKRIDRKLECLGTSE